MPAPARSRRIPTTAADLESATTLYSSAPATLALGQAIFKHIAEGAAHGHADVCKLYELLQHAPG